MIKLVECDRRQTDRPHYGETCCNRRNCLCCKKRFHLFLHIPP